MTSTQRLPVPSPIVGVRLHSKRPAAGSPAAAKVTWLLSLGERERQRAADSAALHTLARSIQQSLQQLPTAVGERLDEIARLAVELGLAVAREIVGDALDKGHVDPTPTVARCLRDCVHGSSGADLVVRLHPADVELVQARLAAMPELSEEVAKARLVADPAIGRGAVRAETGAGRLRYDPREALDRVSAELRREVTG